MVHHSDHRPILINTSPSVTHRPRPFFFEAMWIRDKTVASVIERAWIKGLPLPSLPQVMTKIKNTKVTLKEGNIKVFGRLQTNSKNMRQYIEDLQSQLTSDIAIQSEQKAQPELDELLTMECIHWKEKVKAQ